MTTYSQTAPSLEVMLKSNEPSGLEKLRYMLREELRLIAGVAIKVGAALLVLEALGWFATLGDGRAPETVAASAARAPQADKPARAEPAGALPLLR